MRRYLLMTVLAVFVSFAAAEAQQKIPWVSLKTGTEKARVESRPMIVDFYFGPECPRCAALDKEVYENPLIAKKITDDFIPVRVDLKKDLTAEEKALGEKFDYKMDCLLIFLDADRNLITDQKGKRLCFADKVDPKEFIEYLDYIKGQAQKKEKKTEKNN